MPLAEPEGFDNAAPNKGVGRGEPRLRDMSKYYLGRALCKCRVSVLVLLLTGGEVQGLTHKVSLSHGRWKMEVQINMRGPGRGLLWLGQDQQEKCGAR